MRGDGGPAEPRIALSGRSAALAARADTLAPPLLAAEIEQLRRAAVAEGLVAADRVCRAFTARLARARCRNSYTPWFSALGDAIACAATDEEAVADACLAAVMVRMA